MKITGHGTQYPDRPKTKKKRKQKRVSEKLKQVGKLNMGYK